MRNKPLCHGEGKNQLWPHHNDLGHLFSSFHTVRPYTKKKTHTRSDVVHKGSQIGFQGVLSLAGEGRSSCESEGCDSDIGSPDASRSHSHAKDVAVTYHLSIARDTTTMNSIYSSTTTGKTYHNVHVISALQKNTGAALANNGIRRQYSVDTPTQ